MKLSSTALQIRASVFADLAPRIEARAHAGADLVELHIGDTHVMPPEGARFGRVEAEGYEAALYRYGAIAGVEALKAAFAEELARTGRGPRGVSPGANVLVAAGATHGIFCGLRAVLEPGDEVLVAAPYWPLSVGVVRAAGGVPVEVPLTDRLYADPSLRAADLLEAAVTPRTRAIYLITPNNPDGYVMSDAQLEGIARLAVARDLWVLADEVYADYVYEGAHRSIASLDGMAERTLSAFSLSKSHALAGARVGFLVAPEPVVQLARRVATHTVFNVPVASQRVALAALATGGTWVEGARRAYAEARRATLEALADTGARVHAPHGGSYAFVDFAPVLGGRPLKALLERAIDRGVLLAPGDGCGEAYASWARICFTSVPRPRLVEGLGRLREALRP
ncbi:MAG TPA: pyridoxal phosphate-dependent aminotransferase [Polyangiaceae bacterium]|nr:pyridoxal phosphate-dependent aminotransferase [Polyangiaceae bacterium]